MGNSAFLIGLNQYGVEEIKGGENPEILKYFHSIGHEWVREDETAWCSAYINWCFYMSGKDYTGELTARSWLSIGREIKAPVMGDVAILWRDSRDSWKGHVGFFVTQDSTHVWLLGGNQDNQVNIKAYPKSRVLGYRRI